MPTTQMYDPIDDVLSKAAHEQFDYALDLIRYYTVPAHEKLVFFYCREYNLCRNEGRIFVAILTSHNKTISTEVLLRRIWSADADAALQSLHVTISKIRKKLKRYTSGKVSISTAVGMGYSIEDPENIIKPYKEKDIATEINFLYPSTKGWDKNEDDLMLLLRSRNNTVSEVSIVLRRSARAVKDRYNILAKKHNLPKYWK